ncbi:hypothetical protein K501DRAFT_271057 [Backusella circina FSU 941]|nr:hypothetical protein K501DRAFT_271057 [Backusella circina FSU 941]
MNIKIYKKQNSGSQATNLSKSRVSRLGSSKLIFKKSGLYFCVILTHLTNFILVESVLQGKYYENWDTAADAHPPVVFIEAVPTVLIFNKGQVIDRYTGGQSLTKADEVATAFAALK